MLHGRASSNLPRALVRRNASKEAGRDSDEGIQLNTGLLVTNLIQAHGVSVSTEGFGLQVSYEEIFDMREGRR